jgi:hypothetical protein
MSRRMFTELRRAIGQGHGGTLWRPTATGPPEQRGVKCRAGGRDSASFEPRPPSLSRDRTA